MIAQMFDTVDNFLLDPQDIGCLYILKLVENAGSYF